MSLLNSPCYSHFSYLENFIRSFWKIMIFAVVTLFFWRSDMLSHYSETFSRRNLVLRTIVSYWTAEHTCFCKTPIECVMCPHGTSSQFDWDNLCILKLQIFHIFYDFYRITSKFCFWILRYYYTIVIKFFPKFQKFYQKLSQNFLIKNLFEIFLQNCPNCTYNQSRFFWKFIQRFQNFFRISLTFFFKFF